MLGVGEERKREKEGGDYMEHATMDCVVDWGLQEVTGEERWPPYRLQVVEQDGWYLGCLGGDGAW
jgi:hypothetical protein